MICAYQVSQGNGFLAFVLWWISRLLDGLDGALARYSGQSTRLGAYYDQMADMFAYSGVVVGLYLWHPDLASYWILILTLYILCASGTMILGPLLGESSQRLALARGVALASSLAEAGETGLAYSFLFLLPNYAKEISVIWITFLLLSVMINFLIAKKYLSPQKNS